VRDAEAPNIVEIKYFFGVPSVDVIVLNDYGGN
jgi:hypothetical protein